MRPEWIGSQSDPLCAVRSLQRIRTVRQEEFYTFRHRPEDTPPRDLARHRSPMQFNNTSIPFCFPDTFGTPQMSRLIGRRQGLTRQHPVIQHVSRSTDDARVPEPLAFEHSVTHSSSAYLKLKASWIELRTCILMYIGRRQMRRPVQRNPNLRSQHSIETQRVLSAYHQAPDI